MYLHFQVYSDDFYCLGCHTGGVGSNFILEVQMKNVRWFISLLVLFGMLLAPAQSVTALSMQSPEPVVVTPQAVEAFLDEFTSVYLKKLEVPGLAFVMVKEGSVFVSKGYGYANVEYQVPFDPERTIVRAGSNVKTVTALALVQLAEQGKIDLDADVNRYLTHFKIPDTFDAPITARQLLHYTAGLDNRFIGIRVETPDEILPLSEYFAQRLPDRVRPPGQIRAYNDHEIALAGLLIEEVSGMPYDQYVREYIFKPLGMDSSSIYLPERDAERVALGYSSNGAYPLDYYNLNDAAGSGFNTTPADLARYMLMHLENGKLDGEQVFSESVIEELHTTRFTHHPKLPGIAYTFDETFWGGRRILAKSGGAPGFTNRMLLLLDEDVGVYFVYNRDSTVPLSWKLEQAFLERFYPRVSPTIENEVPATDRKEMVRYTGYYISLNDYSATTIEKVQALMEQEQVTLDEQGRLHYAGGTLLRKDRNLFQWSDSSSYVTFGEDEYGNVNYMFVQRTALMRIPWIETFPVQMSLLGFSLVAFVLSLLGWIIAAIKRQGKSYALSGFLSLIYISFLVGMGLLLAPVFAGADPPWALSFAPPNALLVLLALPLVGVGLTCCLAWRVVRSWKERRSGWFVRIHNTLILVASLGFLVFLHIWNLLGYML